MFQSTFFLVLMVCVATARFANKDHCPPNEEYNECGNPCQEKCDNGEPVICTYQCEHRCFCKQGYVRLTEDGECVPEEFCKPIHY
uniref:Chymotrypsin inhibitor Ani s 6 n=1 Tax=Anisakis simplex TaxID=6269 RepID=TIL6_ANISI|nr:RecName: Full=Chymotrypsin inhibitor Ani s 6; AltName: Allergen=Ani s 6; Flags: Precursor [Anisakis simplex]BAF43535.1 protease inhibitor [Anisakis simplex]